MSLMVMDAGPKGKKNEFKPLDQNLNAVLIKSKSRIMLTLVSLMNWAIPRDFQCPWKSGDSLSTQVIQSSNALGYDLADKAIDHSSFPISIFDRDVIGKERSR